MYFVKYTMYLVLLFFVLVQILNRLIYLRLLFQLFSLYRPVSVSFTTATIMFTPFSFRAKAATSTSDQATCLRVAVTFLMNFQFLCHWRQRNHMAMKNVWCPCITKWINVHWWFSTYLIVSWYLGILVNGTFLTLIFTGKHILLILLIFTGKEILLENICS